MLNSFFPMVSGWIRQTIKWQGTEDGTQSFEQLIIHTLDLQGSFWLVENYVTLTLICCIIIFLFAVFISLHKWLHKLYWYMLKAKLFIERKKDKLSIDRKAVDIGNG